MAQVDVTISIPDKQAQALEASGVNALALHADAYTVEQLLKWNMLDRTRKLAGLVEAAETPPGQLANLGDQVRSLAFAFHDMDAAVNGLPSIQGGES